MAITPRGVTGFTPLNAPPGGTTTTTVTYPALTAPDDTVLLIAVSTLILTDSDAPADFTINSGTTRIVPNAAHGWGSPLGDTRQNDGSLTVTKRLTVWSKVRGAETSTTVTTGTNSNTTDGSLRQSRLLACIGWRGSFDGVVYDYQAAPGPSPAAPPQSPDRPATMGVISITQVTSMPPASRAGWTVDVGGLVNTNSTVLVAALHRDIPAGIWGDDFEDVEPIPRAVGNSIMASYLLYPNPAPSPSGFVRGFRLGGNGWA